MMIMPNKESEWVYYVVCCIHSRVLFFQPDDSDLEAKEREGILKICWKDWKFNLPIWQKGLLVI